MQPWQAPVPVVGPGGKASPEWLRWLQQLLAAGVSIDANSTELTQLKSLIGTANAGIAALQAVVNTLTALKLETNYGLNGSQTLLNLVAGANISLSDNGAGDITISAAPGSGAKSYTTSWSAQTTVTVTHDLGTTTLLWQVFDATGNLTEGPETFTSVDANSFTITFGAAFTGSVVVIG